MSRHWPQSKQVDQLVDYMIREDISQLEVTVLDTDLPTVKNVVIRARPRGAELAIRQGLWKEDPEPSQIIEDAYYEAYQ